MELDKVDVEKIELDMVRFEDIVEFEYAELDDIVELDSSGACLGANLPWFWRKSVISWGVSKPGEYHEETEPCNGGRKSNTAPKSSIFSEVGEK